METPQKERAILVGLSADSMEPKERSTEESLDELGELLETAGGICCAKVLQNRHEPEPRTFIGDGKVQEVKELAQANDCDLAVFDNELSPSQMRALSDDLGIRVIDRSSLILDIFASRARTSEGRLQVELAQYKYLLPRLTGMWTHLVRQSASASPIGTRGPGETQLETDRRHIRRKIQRLEQELEQVRKLRGTQRRRREKNGLPVVALVGYTNAGKSTLLNRLTDAGIPAENRLFDTLDTTTRRLQVSDTLEVLVSDTVGFIRKLPHHLVEAFKATLEELTYADLIVHVIDASNPEWATQVEVVDELILELGAEKTPRIEAFNKFDIVPMDTVMPKGEHIVRISAKTGEGIEALLAKIRELLDQGKRRAVVHIPYEKGAVVELLHTEASVVSTAYKENCVEIEAVMTPETFGKVKAYVFLTDYTEPDPEDYWNENG
jgi:GTP-binding protein HflX